VRETRDVRYRRVTRQFVSLRPLPETDLLSEQLNRVLVGPTRWRPPADVYETHDAITVNVDLAGVDEEDLEMQLYQDALVVEGLRRPKASAEDAQYHLAEIRHGRFRLEIRLPARVNQDAIEGRYDRGLLTITLPKTTTAVEAAPASDTRSGDASR
jgi:HSP20 family protein